MADMRDFSIDMEDVSALSIRYGEGVARKHAREQASDYSNEQAVKHMMYNQIRYARSSGNWFYLVSDIISQKWLGINV